MSGESMNSSDQSFDSDAVDAAACLRESAASLRDDEAESRELGEARNDAVHFREFGTRVDQRALAADDRRSAKADRQMAAQDREAYKLQHERDRVELEELRFDELTGCYQRLTGLSELRRQVLQSERSKDPFTVAFVDINGLKNVNDTRGHEAGDLLIQTVASALRAVLRDYDVVVRFGGDEFVCGMQGMTLQEGQKRFSLINSILNASDAESVSFGVAQREPSESLDAVIRRADAAMYATKGSQQNA